MKSDIEKFGAFLLSALVFKFGMDHIRSVEQSLLKSHFIRFILLENTNLVFEDRVK